nr:unnamed protein product [Spirometra erinaceieuropaei]
MHLIHGHKKHRSRVETSVLAISPPVVADNNGDSRKSSKPMKSRIKSFWRRHSSGKTHNDSENRQPAEDQALSVSPPTSPLSRSSEEESTLMSPTDRAFTSSKILKTNFFPSSSASEVGSRADLACTSTARSSLRSPTGKSVSSSLKQAKLIAGGLIDNNGVCSPSDTRHAEASKYQRPGIANALPRIPEHAAACGYTAAQLEQLTAAVARRQNAPVNRSEYFSAPPGIYWPDIGLSTIPEGDTYDRVNVMAPAVAPSPPAVSSPPRRVASPKLSVSGKEEQAELYRLPRFSLLTRSCRQSSDQRLLSSTTSPLMTGSPPPRASTALSWYSSSPVPTANSPIALLHRPLPPPPKSATALSTSCFLKPDALHVDFPPEGGSQVWQAVPMPNSQFDFEVVDTIVYSNVHVPVLRVASPPTVTAEPSTFSGSSPTRMSQTEETVKPQLPPPQSPSCQDRPIPQRRHISPVDRRKLSPRSRTAQNMATPASGQNYTNCPQGNTIISHHPASPFAPLPRVSPGGQTSPPAVSSRADACPHQSQGQRCCCCCCPELMLSTSAGLNSRSPAEPCSCTHHTRGHIPASSSPSQLISRQNNAGQDDDVGANTRINHAAGANSPRSVLSANRQESITGPRKEISATYEEAWDLKMARRLPGMDVTRLVSVSPAAAASMIPGGIRSTTTQATSGGLDAAERRKSLSPAPAQFTSGGAFRASERLMHRNGRLLAGDAQQPQDDSVVGSVAARASSSRPSFCSHSPSPLLSVLTSTEETNVVPRRVNRSQRQYNYRNSSTDASFGRDIPLAFSHRKHSTDAKAPSPHPSSVSPSLDEPRVKAVGGGDGGGGAGKGTDYDYAYNRSWSMGVQLSLSMNLDQEADISSGNGHTPTENTARRLPPEGQKQQQRAEQTPSSAVDMAESQAPSHRLEPVLFDAASPLPAEAPLSVDTTSGPSTEVQPPSSPLQHRQHQLQVDQRLIRTSRDNHNLLASGVLCYPTDAISSGHKSPEVAAATSTASPKQGAPAVKEGAVETGDSTAVLPPMSRLLTDFDSLSTDSYEEAWDLRHGRVISQLTSTRFIDPEEVFSEVVSNGGHGIGFPGRGGSNCQQQQKQQQPEAADQMSHSKSPFNNVSAAGDCVAPAAPSPPPSCQSTLACQRNASAHLSTPQELKPLHEQTWFHPSLSRSDAETCLRSEPDGSFLVRNSETNKNDFSLTIKHNGFLHMKISRNIHEIL